MVEVGAHIHDETDPVGAAKEREADLMQVFLGDPQSWKAPVLPPYPLGELPFYVHAPYVINVASSNNKVRIPSRKILANHAAAAASIGARALVVHGGHVTKGEDPSLGVESWRKTLERTELPLPVLIENTAGGDHAMARHLDAIARLWDAVGSFEGIGFCLDTCHAWAGGEQLVDVVERVLAITGRIDLVHCNDSRDAFDSGADRHANLGSGEIGADALVEVVRKAGCPVLVETPRAGQAEDIALLRSRL